MEGGHAPTAGALPNPYPACGATPHATWSWIAVWGQGLRDRARPGDLADEMPCGEHVHVVVPLIDFNYLTEGKGIPGKMLRGGMVNG